MMSSQCLGQEGRLAGLRKEIDQEGRLRGRARNLLLCPSKTITPLPVAPLTWDDWLAAAGSGHPTPAQPKPAPTQKHSEETRAHQLPATTPVAHDDPRCSSACHDCCRQDFRKIRYAFGWSHGLSPVNR